MESDDVSLQSSPSTKPVPVPSVVLGVIVAGGFFGAKRRKNQLAKQPANV